MSRLMSILVTTTLQVIVGEEYGILNRQEKALTFGEKVPEDKFKDCIPTMDSHSFYDFTSEDIEKQYNISFSDPEYRGKVLLVVNLASF